MEGSVSGSLSCRVMWGLSLIIERETNQWSQKKGQGYNIYHLLSTGRVEQTADRRPESLLSLCAKKGSSKCNKTTNNYE